MSLRALRASFAKIEDLSRWERSVSIGGGEVVLRALSAKDHLTVVNKTLLAFQDFLRSVDGLDMLSRVMSTEERQEGAPEQGQDFDPGTILIRRTYFEAVNQVRISTMVETTLALALVEINGTDLRKADSWTDEDGAEVSKLDAVLSILEDMWSSETKIRLFQKYDVLAAEMEAASKSKIDLGLRFIEDKITVLQQEMEALVKARDRAKMDPITPIGAELGQLAREMKIEQDLGREVEQEVEQEAAQKAPQPEPVEEAPSGRQSVLPSAATPPGPPIPPRPIVSSLVGAAETAKAVLDNEVPVLDRRGQAPSSPQPMRAPSANPRFTPAKK
jgi:hypothetical protein